MSLVNFYNEMTELESGSDDSDIEKMAAAEIFTEIAEAQEGESIKLASEYDAAGRIMARGYFDEFMKLAEEAAEGEEKKEKKEDEEEEEGKEKKKKLPPALAAALAEKKAALVNAMQQDPQFAQNLYNHYFGE